MRFTEVESIVVLFFDNYKHNLISISAHKFLISFKLDLKRIIIIIKHQDFQVASFVR